MAAEQPLENVDVPRSIVEAATGTVTDWLSGVPAPIRKNAFKAFGQLCTAVIDIPVAILEGVAAEKRAESEARVKIISTGAEQIASQMNVDPEFARVAVRKYGQKIVREQVNLDSASAFAAQELQNSPPRLTDNDKAQQEVAPIEDDWLNNFEKEASQKSSEEMQRLFGRILAGEIRRPSTFSIKTVKLIGQIDTPVANLFKRLCSLSISATSGNHLIDARVSALGGNAGSNALSTYGLSFDQLNLLHEHGLIIADYNSYADYGFSLVHGTVVPIPLKYAGRYWGLLPVEKEDTKEVRLHGVALSRAGKELIDIVDIEADDAYTGALVAFFETKRLKMVEIGSQIR
jgi:Protein of unknown function (DUF2806)